MSYLDIAKPLIGVLLLATGVIFLYSPMAIIRLNALIKNFIADDKRVILYHKKIAIFLISLSFIALYMGGSAFISGDKKTCAGGKKNPSSYENLCAEAIEDYYEGRIRDSLKKTLRALAEHPDEEWALVHLAVVYETLKEKDKARQIYNKALRLYPNNPIVRKKMEMLSSVTDNGKKLPSQNKTDNKGKINSAR